MTSWDSQAFAAGARANGVDPTIIKNARRRARAILAVSAELPVVFTLNHLARLCGVSHGYLLEVAGRQHDPYRDFLMKKRHDAQGAAATRRYRTICVPEPELKKVQSWLQQNILSKIDPHSASTAYAARSTLRSAALRHVRARWLIKIDIERFFESIREPYVASVFERLGYPKLLAFQMARLCTRLPSEKSRKDIFRRKAAPANGVLINTWIGFLPQGAPTSPQLANLVMRRFDSRIAALAKKAGLRYSRYSDDLIFSNAGSYTRPQAENFIHEVYDVLGAHGFEANRTKTSVSAPGARKIVLGLLVDRDEPRLTRNFRSNIETHLHYLERADVGPVKHANARGFDSIIGLQRHLFGLIAFAKQIDLSYGDRLAKRMRTIAWPS